MTEISFIRKHPFFIVYCFIIIFLFPGVYYKSGFQFFDELLLHLISFVVIYFLLDKYLSAAPFFSKSFKVINKYVPSVWKSLLYALCGESLCNDPKYNSIINGITISPKKNFCIIKIWLCNCSVKDVNIIIPILNLPKQGCLFKKHEPEF